MALSSPPSEGTQVLRPFKYTVPAEEQNITLGNPSMVKPVSTQSDGNATEDGREFEKSIDVVVVVGTSVVVVVEVELVVVEVELVVVEVELVVVEVELLEEEMLVGEALLDGESKFGE